jgi:replication factor C subunit 3/5
MNKRKFEFTFNTDNDILHEKEQDTNFIGLYGDSKISPWVEKYRPTSLTDIIDQTDVISTLKIFIKDKSLPHILFYGPPGTGKTSTIMACAHELYGDYLNFMVLELNASDNRGIETIRGDVKTFVTNKNVYINSNVFKLVILDEIDAMTLDAQAILRQIIEKYTSTARFCLICNYIQNINPALLSRCQKFRFNPINNKFIIKKSLEIAKKEGIKLTRQGVMTIIHNSGGDMRKVINHLQSVSMAYSIVNEKSINICLGYPSKKNIVDMIEYVMSNNLKDSCNYIQENKKNLGLSISNLLKEFHDILLEYIMTSSVSIDQEIDIILSNNYDLKGLCNILDEMRYLEYYHSNNTNEKLLISGLVSLFILYKNIIV